VGDGEVFINVQSKLEHPQYNSNTLIYDYSLLRLATPAVLSANIGLVCLPADTTQVPFLFIWVSNPEFINLFLPTTSLTGISLHGAMDSNFSVLWQFFN
jgi:hypothetical protein